ncbi:hypothetical protein KQI84_16620 [bacterium]|nr:hypothetical protein [bacterium]
MNIILMILPPLLFGFAAYGLSLFLTQRSIELAHKGGLLAHPNERSSHTVPTPRVGGIGMIGSFLVLVIAYQVLAGPIQRLQGFVDVDTTPWLPFAGFAISVALAFGLGLWDDQGDPPALVKLAGQFIIAAIPPAMGLLVRQVAIPFVGVFDLPAPVGAIIGFLWIVGLMNAVNFMDGINGLAGRFAQVIAVLFIAVGLNRSWCTEFAIFGAVLYGAAEGFLRWNLPKAKTFLGDCGSQPLGALVAGGVLLLVNNDLRFTPPRFDPFLGGVILVSPFLFDVAYTLVHRTIRGKNILHAHREHLYQRFLIARGEDHVATLRYVSFFMWGAAIVALLYIRFSVAENEVFRALLLAAAGVLLVAYAARAILAERRAGGAP